MEGALKTVQTQMEALHVDVRLGIHLHLIAFHVQVRLSLSGSPDMIDVQSNSSFNTTSRLIFLNHEMIV